MYNKAYVREALKTGLLRHETPATFHQYVPQMYNKAYVREALKTGLLPRETPATFHQHALQTCTQKHLSLSCSLSLSRELPCRSLDGSLRDRLAMRRRVATGSVAAGIPLRTHNKHFQCQFRLQCLSKYVSDQRARTEAAACCFCASTIGYQ